MKALLSKSANWKFILLTFIASAGCIYSFQLAQEGMNKQVGEEAPMIDMRSGYDAAEVKDFFTKLGPEGRHIHRQSTMVTDSIFPFAYGALFVLLAAFFLKRIFGPKSNWMYLSLLPVLLMIVDFRENLNTFEMLDAFPDLSEEMVASASRVTDLKSTMVSVSMLLPVVLGIVWLAKWMYMRQKK